MDGACHSCSLSSWDRRLLIAWAFVTKGFEGLGLYLHYMLTIALGAVGIGFIAVPGLLYLDRAGTRGFLPSLALGIGVGIFTGFVVWWLMGGTSLWVLLLSYVGGGIGFGLLGTTVYWICNRWFARRKPSRAATGI